MYTSPEDHRAKGTYVQTSCTDRHNFYTMTYRIEIGTRVSARVGPYEPPTSTGGRPLKARVDGKVLASGGPGEWVVEWSSGVISRQHAKSMRIISPPTTAGSSQNPVSGTVARTEVVDNGNQGASVVPAGAGPSATPSSAAMPFPPSAPSGAPSPVGSTPNGSTPAPSSGDSTAPPTIWSAAPSSATNVSQIESEQA